MTCPLSLVAIIFLLFIIFYSVSNIIILAAVGILFFILFNFGKIEKFVGFGIEYKEAPLYVENPDDTGFGYALFGPLYPVTSKVMKEQQYRTMRGLPWCDSPLGETQEGEILCKQRS